MSRRVPHLRALGLDLGERRIGVAISDSGGVLALPLCTIERSGDTGADHAEIERIVDERGVKVVVVGLPLALSGRMGPAAVAAQERVPGPVGGARSVGSGSGDPRRAPHDGRGGPCPVVCGQALKGPPAGR